ncbi:serine protease [Candidatus Uabimicrobium sp. HlEnr_7]|uniref:trypsin-like serine peptidase n=1 Tax=Candidatus Uabimicrobium helgolandensis TaxID=3095367 RepID=UPI003556AFA9
MKKLIVLLMVFSCAALIAEDQIPFSKQPVELNSGVISGSRSLDNVTFRQIVSIPDAQWLRVHFSDYNLGSKSYVKITSLKDHGVQTLDGKNLKMWHDASAYFNGSRVLVELFASPQDVDVFIQCSEVSAGEKGGVNSRSICGNTDDRKASNDKRSGRLVPVGCTGWIIGNGYLTAGHCVDGHSVELLEFNVPASDPDGSINHPAPQHQYPVLGTTEYKNGGQGNDWCTFKVGANSVTGLTPLQAQKSFFKIANDINPEQIRITGYGVDNMPRGSSGSRNKDSQTQQTHVGPFVQLSGGQTLRYSTDTTGGNSGSPVISETHQTTVGIHTHGGCGSWGGDNAGTSFKNPALSKAVQLLTVNTIFVDNTHPSTVENGDIFHPYHSINNAIEKTQDKSIQVAPGVYTESLAINKGIAINAITDVVVIGEVVEANPTILNNAISGNQEINTDVVQIGSDFRIQKGANIVINAKSISFSSISIPDGASLTINIVK